MKIDQKRTLFLDGKLAADRLLTAADLATVGVRDGRQLNQALFEENSMLSSGGLGQMRPFFLVAAAI